ncbi:MAG: hypothetical protein K2M67_09445, partial [Muribaculaceae bacterium]|nr:hypothetical protein [Muribaculaceae bacterium]
IGCCGVGSDICIRDSLFSYFCSVNSYPPLLSPLSAAPLLSGRPASRYDDGILSSRIQLDIKQQ